MSDLEKAKDEQVEENLNDLATHVMQAFSRAKQHRDGLGVTDSITDSLRRFRGKYDCEDKTKFDGISVYRGLTGMLVRSAYSWLKDAYFNAQDRPWTIQPTPEPELPEALQEELNMIIEAKLQEQLNGAGLVSSQSQSMIKELRNTASSMAMDFAMESTKGMSTLIEDQLTEAGFHNILSEFLLNVAIFPYAILKGPVIRMETVPVWKNGKYMFTEKPKYCVDIVSPMNFYPSPDSSTTQDGEFLIEMMEISRSNLNSSKKLKFFSKDAIDLVLRESALYGRSTELAQDDAELEELDGVKRNANERASNFTAYVYTGRISGDQLIEYAEMDHKLDKTAHNFDETVETDWGTIDPYMDYETEIWVINGVTIMTRLLKPTPVPYRPYYVTSAYKIPGSIFGECIPLVIADLQDEINTAARSRMYNMGMSSGPVVEADMSRFQDNEIPENIQPWMVIPVSTNSAQNNNSAPALRFTSIPNVSQQLTAVMEEAWDKAHRIAGIPPYMYGDDRGSAPTLGAFSLQYAGATKGIKTIISNIDIDIVEKLVEQFYYYNMVFHEDDSIKADAKVKVRGAAGLIAQEQRQARPLELLQALGPILAQMQPETALALAHETLMQSGYDPSKLGAASSAASAEASNRMVGTQGPQPDGRSGNVAQQLAQGQMPAPVQQ